MTDGAEHFGILLLSKTRSKSRLSPGKIDTSIFKRRIFEMLLRQAKTLCACFGRRLITDSTINLCDCGFGRQQTTDLRYGERSAMVGTDRRAVRSVMYHRRARRSRPTR